MLVNFFLGGGRIIITWHLYGHVKTFFDHLIELCAMIGRPPVKGAARLSSQLTRDQRETHLQKIHGWNYNIMNL